MRELTIDEINVVAGGELVEAIILAVAVEAAKAAAEAAAAAAAKYAAEQAAYYAQQAYYYMMNQAAANQYKGTGY